LFAGQYIFLLTSTFILSAPVVYIFVGFELSEALIRLLGHGAAAFCSFHPALNHMLAVVLGSRGLVVPP